MVVNLPWRIELFGGLRACLGERRITRFAHQKSAMLLACLALHPGRIYPREELSELLWPETEPEVGRHNLRQTLLSLRRQLEIPGTADPAPPLILAHRSDLQLSPAVTTDVTEFEAGLREADRASDPGTRAEWLARAVQLYQGPLLPGYYDEWVLRERERLAHACLTALRQLAQLLAESGDLERGLEYSRMAVALDPLTEEAHAELIRLLIAAGRPAEAGRQFQELVRVFREELDSEPSPEVSVLVRQLAVPVSTSVPQRRAVTSSRSSTPSASSLPPRSEARASALLDLVPAPEVIRLPAPLTRFFGREEEIDQLDRWLRDPEVRLITLTGPGGSGISARRRPGGHGWRMARAAGRPDGSPPDPRRHRRGAASHGRTAGAAARPGDRLSGPSDTRSPRPADPGQFRAPDRRAAAAG